MQLNERFRKNPGEPLYSATDKSPARCYSILMLPLRRNMLNRLLRCLILLLLVAAASGVWAELPALIPRAVLFSADAFRSPRLSPDGKQLAYLAPDEQQALQLWVRATAGGDALMLSRGTNGKITGICWAPDGHSLYYLQDRDGNEKWRVFAVPASGGAPLLVLPQPVTSNDLTVLPDFPADLFVRESGHSTIIRCRLNRDTGAVEQTAMSLPSGTQEWSLAPNGAAITCMRNLPRGEQSLEAYPLDGPPRILYHWGAGDQGSLLGYTEHGKALLVLSNKDAATMRLLRVDVAGGESRVLAEDTQTDVASVVSDADGAIAVMFEQDKPAWRVLAGAFAADFALLAKTDSGVFSIAGHRRDTWLVAYHADDKPVRYYRYDRTTKQLTLLFSANPQLADAPLAKCTPISFTARDGLPIHGYLTLPLGLPDKSLPMVLLVHGGPWDRDHWECNARVQWLANRGYAVLQVNFRGSTGFGKHFLLAGNHAWGGAMQDDLSDAVAWAVAQGIADPRRVAIMGSSYGGYAALCGLTFTPELYAAGIDLSGPSDLVALREYRKNIRTPLGIPEDVVIGNPATERDFLTARSPSSATAKIHVPLLIGQGANDPRVPKRITDQLVDALLQAGKPVEYLVYPDEGHGLIREANQLDFYARAEALLARCLGGRCEENTHPH